MRKTNLWLAIVFAVSSFFVSQIAMAANTSSNQQLQGADRVSQLMNQNVKDQSGQTLGKVDDVVIGNQGQVSYVILSANDKLYPIPFQALHQGANKNEFIANISKDQLNNAPSFAKNEWPDLTSSQWEQRVFSYYGEQTPQQNQMNMQQREMMQPNTMQPNAQVPGERGIERNQMQQRPGMGY